MHACVVVNKMQENFVFSSPGSPIIWGRGFRMPRPSVVFRSSSTDRLVVVRPHEHSDYDNGTPEANFCEQEVYTHLVGHFHSKPGDAPGYKRIDSRPFLGVKRRISLNTRGIKVH